MKKSKMTILTSAILSMAAYSVSMTTPQSSDDADKVCAMAPVYGPPPSYSSINCDVNNDKQVNIADVCLIKSMVESGTNDDSDATVYDVNKDNSVDWLDFHAVRNYFLGITPEIDEDQNPLATTPPPAQPEYGPPVTTITDPVTTVGTIPQTKYGPPPVFTTETSSITTPSTQPVYGTPVTTITEPATTVGTIPQAKYGPPPVFTTETSPITSPDN